MFFDLNPPTPRTAPASPAAEMQPAAVDSVAAEEEDELTLPCPPTVPVSNSTPMRSLAARLLGGCAAGIADVLPAGTKAVAAAKAAATTNNNNKNKAAASKAAARKAEAEKLAARKAAAVQLVAAREAKAAAKAAVRKQREEELAIAARAVKAAAKAVAVKKAAEAAARKAAKAGRSQWTGVRRVLAAFGQPAAPSPAAAAVSAAHQARIAPEIARNVPRVASPVRAARVAIPIKTAVAAAPTAAAAIFKIKTAASPKAAAKAQANALPVPVPVPTPVPSASPPAVLSPLLASHALELGPAGCMRPPASHPLPVETDSCKLHPVSHPLTLESDSCDEYPASHPLLVELDSCDLFLASRPLTLESDSCDLHPVSHPLMLECCSCDFYPVSHPLSKEAREELEDAGEIYPTSRTRPMTEAFQAKLLAALRRERAEPELSTEELGDATYTFEPAQTRRVPSLPELLCAFAEAEDTAEGESLLNALFRLVRATDDEVDWFRDQTPHSAAEMLDEHEAAADAAAVTAAAALAASRARWAKRVPGAPRPCITAVTGGEQAYGLVEDALLRNFRASPTVGFKVFFE